MRNIVFLLVFASCLCGCRTKYVAVPEYHVRDSVVLRTQRDSVFFHDSVFVSQYTVGDTVYRDRVRTAYRYMDRLRTDTVLVEKRDSVPYIVEKKVVEREYRARWYDKVCRLFTVVAVLGVAVWFLARYVRKRTN